MAIVEKQTKKSVTLGPLNRVEGDLEFKMTVEGNRITQLHTEAVMFRGWEVILKDKDPWLGITVTPRACGICGISHIMCAVKAVDSASGNGLLGTGLPPGAMLLRNIIAATESYMSGMRHFWLLFSPDLVNARYADSPYFPEMMARFAPFSGSSYRAAVAWSKKPVEITAIFAGQQPHPAAIIPGGVTTSPSLADVTKSLGIFRDVREHFVEKVMLRGSVERYLECKTWEDLQKWMGEGEHEDSDLGLFIKFALHHGMDKYGRGVDRFLGWPCYEYPSGQYWYPGGVYHGAWAHGGRYEAPGDLRRFQARVTEDITHAWFEGTGAAHPFEEVTRPVKHLGQGPKHSWSKAPRFDGKPCEVGPLARLLCQGDPLIRDMERKLGPSVFLRNYARLHEIATATPVIEKWLKSIDIRGPFYVPTERKVMDGEYWGWHEAHRGALAHWVVFKGNKIANYQIIAPTTWNVGPQDAQGQVGPIAAACMECPADNLENPVEVFHALRSFDPCLVCTVHMVEGGCTLGRYRLTI